MDLRSWLTALRRIWTGSITRKLTLGISLLLSGGILLFVANRMAHQRSVLQQNAVERAQALAETLAANAPSWVMASDVEGLQELLKALRRYPDLDYAMVLDRNGKVLGHTDGTRVGHYVTDPTSRSLLEAPPELRVLAQGSRVTDVVTPVNAGGRHLAWVRVGLRDDQLQKSLDALRREGILFAVVAVLLGAAYTAILARGLTQGLRHLIVLAGQVGEGRQAVRATLKREDELGRLGQAFNAMARDLEQSARSLREGETHLTQLLENLPVAVAVYAMDGTLDYANPMARRFMGPEGQGGSPGGGPSDSFRFIREDGQPLPLEEYPVRRVLRDKLPMNGQVLGSLPISGEEPRWAFVNAFPESDEHGTLQRVIVGFVDITERHRAEAENRRLESEVEHAQRLESLGNLAGGVAHDMNNILAAILGLASMHKDPRQSGERLAKVFGTIESAGLRGRDLVKRLLQFARKGIEAVHVLDLNALVREEAELLSRTTLKKAQWNLDLQEPLNPVRGEATTISTAIINLCVNSVDAMERGGAITLRTRNLPSEGVSLEVVDTGEGMTPEVLARAMDPFFTTKPQGKGTGMGLSIVYGTMKAHGGSVEIESRKGEGTTVRLHFPPLHAFLGGSAESGLPCSPRMRATPLRILLVDDDDWVRESTAPMLQMAGHEVRAAESGEAALAFVAAGFDPDLVVLDQNMPNLTGMETLQRILVLRPDQRALFTSGAGEPDLSQLPPGARVGFLPKPFTLHELLASIE